MVDAFASLSVVDLKVQDDLTVTDDMTVGGTLGVTGVLTTTATQVATGGITSGSNIVSDTDSTDDLGTTGTRWANLFVDAITATDQITATGFTGTLDGILGSGSAAAATVTTLDTSGAVNLNLTTDSTSSTSGALIVDGGVGIAKKLFVGTDFDVTGNAVIDGTALVTGVLTTTAAAVFNGGFASNAASTITIDDNGTALTLVSTDADATLGPQLNLYRNSASPVDNDFIGQIYYTGRNDNSQDFTGAAFLVRSTDVSDGSEDVELRISVMSAGSVNNMLRFLPAETVFNEEHKDIDFRVESDDETHAIFVNAGDDVVNFFTTTTVNASSGAVGPDGVSHYADGRTDISRASGQPLNLRRRTNDGIIANFYKEASGTTADVGSIATQGGRLSIGSGDTNLNFNASANSMYPISNATTGTLSNGAIDLGAATAQFKDLYLGGTARLDNSSSITGKTSGASSFNIASGHTGSGLSLFIGQFGVSAAAGLTISTAREVTMPAQPSFHVVKNADQNNIATGSNVTVLWQVESYDVGANFASNTFTAPVAGKYILTASIRVDSLDSTASEHNDMAIVTSNRNYKNIFDLRGLSSDPTYWTFTINAVADMDSGDTAFITFYQDGGTAQSDIKNDSGRTYFSGILVG
jgi:hypothetical protein